MIGSPWPDELKVLYGWFINAPVKIKHIGIDGIVPLGGLVNEDVDEFVLPVGVVPLKTLLGVEWHELLGDVSFRAHFRQQNLHPPWTFILHEVALVVHNAQLMPDVHSVVRLLGVEAVVIHGELSAHKIACNLPQIQRVFC